MGKATHPMIRVLYEWLLSALGAIFMVAALFYLKTPSEWYITLAVMFMIAVIAFFPIVRFEGTSFSLSGIFALFCFIAISPWATIWVNGMEVIVITVVGVLPPSKTLINIGQIGLATWFTGLIWWKMGELGVPIVFNAIICVFIYFMSNSFLVALFFRLTKGFSFTSTLLSLWKDTALSYLSLLTLGAMAALLDQAFGIVSILLIVVLYLFIRFMLQQRMQDANIIRKYADELKVRYNASISSLARAIDARDPYTFGHSERVAEMSRRISQSLELALDPEDVYFAGLLHDVGKIALDDSVLLKPGKLTMEEFALIMQHPLLGEEILRGSGVSDLILEAVRFHHEWMSGGGYPDNLQGEAIPAIARVVSVADAFDAMVSNRPYRKGCTLPEARERLQQGRDTQFDAHMVDAFIMVLDSISEVELQRIGYGDQPPNYLIPPVSQISDSSHMLSERLLKMGGRDAHSRGEVGQAQVAVAVAVALWSEATDAPGTDAPI